MVRAANLFAAASIALLIAGLVFANFFQRYGMTVGLPGPGSHTHYGFGYQVPCFGLAGLFAIFAAFYAFGRVRWSPTIVDWHLWLTLSGVAMCGLCWALFGRVIEGANTQSGQRSLLFIAVGMFLGMAAFVVGQLLVTIALLIRLAAPHR